MTTTTCRLPTTHLYSLLPGDPPLWSGKLPAEPAPNATVRQTVLALLKHAKEDELNADQYGVQLALGNDCYLPWMQPTARGLHELITQSYRDNEALIMYVLPHDSAHFVEAVPTGALPVKAPASAVAAAEDEPTTPARASPKGELIINEFAMSAMDAFPLWTPAQLKGIHEHESQRFDSRDRKSFLVVATAGSQDSHLQQLAYSCFDGMIG